ncbi:MAG: 3-ketoacyl-CoA thiolase, partial [Actinobacteria bacterium]|nr:3-ketoacyl-CoA thiolase [Actinomycetota bacterium]NIU65435.1 3-ketoacyl-CoA thiolase [Actinomycetota bacterium]NIV86411.1 3-ketoacyl-CoA thiolase [Actinomycetota bacterium]NIW27241.1 3-ketoacyl-CoA thiolase [Actinomycetota bacterium]NIX19776.1 3-ketoacyl-CoA thiolase [Actinomycetota bacterium]
MPEAYVIGAGQSPFGSYPEETYLSLFETAYDRALSSVEGELDPGRIGAA